MFNSLKQFIQRYRDKQKLARQIDPKAFQQLTAELLELASVAERLWPRQHKFYTKIKRIQAEMEQLERLTTKPQFKRLSSNKRIKLRQSLIKSREQLIETVQTAPTPTSTLQ